jgi:hypothetical protein
MIRDEQLRRKPERRSGPTRTGAVRVGEAPSDAVPAADIRFTVAGEMAASAGFPDQANKFPDGPI